MRARARRRPLASVLTRAISRPLRKASWLGDTALAVRAAESEAQRSLKKDNAGVKDGTIRKGKGGKTVRKYNAKTGRWEVLRVIDKRGRTRRSSTSTTDTRSKPSERDRRVHPGRGTKKKSRFSQGGGGLVGSGKGNKGIDPNLGLGGLAKGLASHPATRCLSSVEVMAKKARAKKDKPKVKKKKFKTAAWTRKEEPEP